MSKFVPVRDCPVFLIPAKYKDYVHDLTGDGSGSLGVVKKFNSPDGSPSIAIKKFTLPFQTTYRGKLVLRELNLLKRLQHPNIVRFVEMYTADSRAKNLESVYHITEHCGLPLTNIMKDAQYPMNTAKIWMRELISALQYMNSLGISHRNLIPGNMCISSSKGEPKLTLLGFGKARVLADEGNTRGPKDTDPYMAIEMQVDWTETYDEKVDIWSMATILCELLTGVVLFSDPKAKSILKLMVQYCGPVDTVVINKMSLPGDRQAFTDESTNVNRINFVTLLKRRANGRRGINADDIDNEPHLGDFIERTLQLNSRRRMSAHRCLAHPFLSGTKGPTEEDLPKQEDDGIAACRQHVWDVIHSTKSAS